jgi:hypothetical protein
MAVLSAPFDCFVGLRDADTGEELTRITFGAYTRVPGHFAFTADGITIANSAAIVWPIAASDWGGIDAALLWTGPTLAEPGDLLATVPATQLVDTPMYARIRIPPAGISGLIVTVPRPYGIGTYGTGRYGTNNTLDGTAVLELTFDTSGHVCAPGTWAPGPFAAVAA